MATNLGIDDDLLDEALRIGGYSSKKDTVNQALREFIRRRKQLEAIEMFGKFDFDPDYDYKKQRRRK